MSERRARVKVKKATTRAEACAEFERKKTRQRRAMVKRRLLMGAGTLMLSYTAISFAWAAHTGRLQESLARTQASFWQGTAAFGFRVDQVTLTGRAHASAKQIKAALGVEQGSPILATSLTDIKIRLEKIPEIESVQISRVLPSEIAIAITERTPIAWWQKDGVLHLLDAHGVVLERAKYPGKKTLPVVVGEDAPAHVGELLALLTSQPSLKPDVTAAVRVGGRRWNIELTHGITVMLPEEKPQEAWNRFANLVEKQALLSKAIRSVDMRLEDRVFILPVEQEKSPVTLTSARET